MEPGRRSEGETAVAFVREVQKLSPVEQGGEAMSSSGKSRIAWTCPECSRTFRIPKTKRQPRLCPKCSKRGSASSAAQSAGAGDSDESYFQEAEPPRTSSLKFGVVAQPAAPPAKVPLPDTGDIEPPVDGSSTSIDELSDRVDEILEHLEGISRTMKLVRWVMWGLGFATVLSVVVTAGGLLYSMSMIGSLGDLLNQPGGEIPLGEMPLDGGRGGAMQQGDVKIPPQLQQQMQPIKEYSDTVNELLKEVNQ